MYLSKQIMNKQIDREKLMNKTYSIATSDEVK